MSMFSRNLHVCPFHCGCTSEVFSAFKPLFWKKNTNYFMQDSVFLFSLYCIPNVDNISTFINPSLTVMVFPSYISLRLLLTAIYHHV